METYHRDVVNHGVATNYWMQVVNGEILISDGVCARHDENYEIVWLTDNYISVQRTLDLLNEIRIDIFRIVANSCTFITVSNGQTEDKQ